MPQSKSRDGGKDKSTRGFHFEKGLICLLGSQMMSRNLRWPGSLSTQTVGIYDFGSRQMKDKLYSRSGSVSLWKNSSQVERRIAWTTDYESRPILDVIIQASRSSGPRTRVTRAYTSDLKKNRPVVASCQGTRVRNDCSPKRCMWLCWLLIEMLALAQSVTLGYQG